MAESEEKKGLVIPYQWIWGVAITFFSTCIGAYVKFENMNTTIKNQQVQIDGQQAQLNDMKAENKIRDNGQRAFELEVVKSLEQIKGDLKVYVEKKRS